METGRVIPAASKRCRPSLLSRCGPRPARRVKERLSRNLSAKRVRLILLNEVVARSDIFINRGPSFYVSRSGGRLRDSLRITRPYHDDRVKGYEQAIVLTGDLLVNFTLRACHPECNEGSMTMDANDHPAGFFTSFRMTDPIALAV